jgi:hypothetical protein
MAVVFFVWLSPVERDLPSAPATALLASFEAQFVAMLFWGIQALFAGAFFLRAVFWIRGVVDFLASAAIVGFLLLSVSYLLVYWKEAATHEQGMAYAAMALFALLFASFLILIAREVAAATFSLRR